jgi:hypothetical protein
MDLILNWKLDFAILAVLDFSIISLIVAIVGSAVDCSAPVFKSIDFTFHIIVGVLVICASSLLLDAVFKWELNEYSSKGIYSIEQTEKPSTMVSRWPLVPSEPLTGFSTSLI